MAAQQLNRTDTTDTNTPATTRWVLYKSFEEDTPAALQLAMNLYILGLPASFPEFGFDIVTSEHYYYVSEPPQPSGHHVCFMQIYFEGRDIGTTPPQALGV